MSNVLYYFEQTVTRFPDKTAVAYEDSRYSFSELMHTAKRLGAKLCGLSLRDEPIAVLVNRGRDTVIMFLGVSYSGNYYIPIDPDMPVSKIRSIIHDSGAAVILGSDENAGLLDEISFEGQFWTLGDLPDTEIDYRDVPDVAPLYMVYTSGSTGKPKGVLKSHGSIISFIKAFADTFSISSHEVIGNQTPFFFDAAAKDLYLMMYTGAVLEVIPSKYFIFPVTLMEYMNRHKITYICWVPTALSLVTQMNTFRKIVPQYLNKVFFVGEVFPMKQLQKWMAALPNVKYVNLYGSSEIAGVCCYYEISGASEGFEVLPIGKELENCTVFLVNENRIVTEKDRIGEVHVAGDALALGYLNDPVKTAEVFSEGILPDGRRGRVLKTGDLARYDDAGNLVFVSRKDFQIKHMGRRIELGEIEAAADTIEEVQRCCCLYNDKKNRIELFCELIPNCSMSSKEVQSAMRGRISDYMLPSKINILEHMPYNANGKIDRILLGAMM